MKKKEIGWINTVKAICIILVYAYHLSVYLGYDTVSFKYYSPFFVTSFFFTSGYLVFKKILNSKGCITCFVGGVRLDSLLFKITIPTLVFSFINYFPKVFLRGAGFNLDSFLRDTFLGGSLWFTSALVVSELILYILLLSRRKEMSFYIVMSLLIAVGAVIIGKYTDITILGDSNIPWYYKAGMVGTLYMVCGGLYKTIEEKYEHFAGKLQWIMITAGVMLYFVTVYSPQIPVTVVVNLARLNIVGFFVSTLGILLLVSISKHVPNTRAINFIGRHTMVMYFLSGGIPNVFSLVALRLGMEVNIYTYLFGIVVSFAIAVLFAFIIDKYIPFLIDLRCIKT